MISNGLRNSQSETGRVSEVEDCESLLSLGIIYTCSNDYSLGDEQQRGHSEQAQQQHC